MFCRALSPRSAAHLRTTYFYSTSGDKRFADVRAKGFCLRCYGSNHKASSCRLYTQPTLTPCRYCFHLFHPTKACKFYDQNGKSRASSRSSSGSYVRSSSKPPSRPASLARDKWLVPNDESQNVPPKNDFQLSPDSNVISELWDNEYDFHYMCDYQLYNNEVNAQSQLASAAVKAQRAKFHFPSSDPQESDIQDTRTSEQKMSDILRIWSQCLTKDESQVETPFRNGICRVIFH